LGVFTSCGADEEATALTYVNEGVFYSQPDGFFVHQDLKSLSSGQKCQAVLFTNISCGKQPDKLCEADKTCTWEDKVPSRLRVVNGEIRGSSVRLYVLVDENKLEEFNKKITSGHIDVADYGKVLCSGWRDQPKEIKRKFKVRFCSYVKPVSE
jgi:hypothetical protein